jgi:hypothetical protein
MPPKIKSKIMAARPKVPNVNSPVTKGTCSKSGGVLTFFILSIATILFVLIFLSLYRSQRDSIRNITNSQQQIHVHTEHFDQKDSRLYFFFMDGCGWCERFMPTWEELNSKHVNTQGLTLRKVSRSDKLATQYADHVSGYPTLLLVKPDDTVVKFTGDRTVSAIEDFLSKNGVALKAAKEKFDEPNRVKIPNNVGDASRGVQGAAAEQKEEMEKMDKKAGVNGKKLTKKKESSE